MDRLFWMMPKAVFTVMVFWFVVSLFFSGQDIVYAGERFVYALLIASLAFIGGFIVWYGIYFVFYKDYIVSLLESSEIKEVKLNLYTSNDKKKNKILHTRIPLPLRALPSKRIDKNILKQWDGFTSYKAKHPRHAEVFEAIFRVLSHYSYIPATHHPEGHGGFSLLVHSMNVVRLMDKLGEQFKYFGVYQNKKLISPLRESENLSRGYYQVDQGEPLLPIIALAHDIGKIEAFKPTHKDNKLQALLRRFGLIKYKGLVEVERVFGAHDLLGKKLLLNIPEIYLLSWQERNDLLNAVGYHHHYAKSSELEDFTIQGLPYSNVTSDRQHALAALLDYVDTQTSYLEGGAKIKPFFVPDGMSDDSDANSSSTKNSSKDTESSNDNNPSEPQEAINSTEPSESLPTDEQSEPEDIEGAVFQWLRQLVKEEGKSKRGNSQLNRLEGWIYLDELFWRNWLFKKSKPVQQPETLTLKEPSVLHPVTIELLNTISEKQGMPEVLDINEGAPKLFTVSVDRNNGSPYLRTRVIVFKESLMGFKVGLRKSSRAITIVGQTDLTGKPAQETAPKQSSQSKEDLPNQEGVNNQEPVQKPVAEKEPSQTDSNEKEATQNKADTDALIMQNVEAFIEWVTLVQNLEFPNEDPFEELKIKGRPFAKVNVMRVPKRFVEGGKLAFPGSGITVNEEEQCLVVPIQLRKRMRS